MILPKEELINRVKWLYLNERIHAIVTFPAIIIYLLINHSVSDIFLLMYGLLVCTIILLQGQHYWKLKLFRLTARPIDQERNIRFFYKLKNINLILIGLIPVIFILQLYLSNWSVKGENLFAWAIFANIFAVLEHINYYHIQLMIDNKRDLEYLMKNKRFKTASLKKDLADNRF
jgi:hypothetical protein